MTVCRNSGHPIEYGKSEILYEEEDIALAGSGQHGEDGGSRSAIRLKEIGLQLYAGQCTFCKTH